MVVQDSDWLIFDPSINHVLFAQTDYAVFALFVNAVAIVIGRRVGPRVCVWLTHRAFCVHAKLVSLVY